MSPSFSRCLRLLRGLCESPRRSPKSLSATTRNTPTVASAAVVAVDLVDSGALPHRPTLASARQVEILRERVTRFVTASLTGTASASEAAVPGIIVVAIACRSRIVPVPHDPLPCASGERSHRGARGPFARPRGQVCEGRDRFSIDPRPLLGRDGWCRVPWSSLAHPHTKRRPSRDVCSLTRFGSAVRILGTHGSALPSSAGAPADRPMSCPLTRSCI
jgi:hypothetical protein